MFLSNITDNLAVVYLSEMRFGKFGHLKDGSQNCLAQYSGVCKSIFSLE